jgi:hypothetical protein
MANGTISRNVRIHPYAPKKGYRVKTYNVFGMPLFEERGWYRIDMRQDQFDMLRMIRTEPDNLDSKAVFDIYTDEERRVAEIEEKRAAEPHANQPSAVNLDKVERDARYLEDSSRGRKSVDLTTADLPRADADNVTALRELDDGGDLAPPVPAAPANALDGAVVQKRGRGRPKKVRPEETPAE